MDYQEFLKVSRRIKRLGLIGGSTALVCLVTLILNMFTGILNEQLPLITVITSVNCLFLIGVLIYTKIKLR